MKRNWKATVISTLVVAGCIAVLGAVTYRPVMAQLIYGNTFPFWNVTGPLTVNGTTTLTGALNASGANSIPITGVTTSSVAAAGIVGEMIQGSTTLASNVALTSGYVNPKGFACVSLTPGDWDVQAVGAFSSTSATYSAIAVGVNTNALSTTLPTATQVAFTTQNATAISGASNVTVTSPVVPLQLNAATTYCGVASAGFASATRSVWRVPNARRVT